MIILWKNLDDAYCRTDFKHEEHEAKKEAGGQTINIFSCINKKNVR